DGDTSEAVACAATWALGEAEMEDRSSTSKLAAGLSWLGAALAADDVDGEVAARRFVAAELSGEARAAVEASAALAALVDRPNVPHDFVNGDYASAQLMNLELALPGSDPRRRAAALHGLGGALGSEAQLDAVALAAWSELAAGEADKARESFQAVVENRPEDIAAWEGMRAASEMLADHKAAALAAAHLGALCRDDGRGAEFWEKAGLTLLEHTDAHDDAEIAFDRAFERNPRRAVAFDKLFRRVRSRNEDDRLLTIIGRRLQVADDDTEIAKMYWERARVLRKKGDRDGALAALENVTMLEPDHVGALALAGEIQITRGHFADAAPLLGRLSANPEAPTQQRLMSGIAAVDLYENKLGEHAKALEVLVGLHRAGLSTLPVRERLAKAAAKTGSWREATAILEQLMTERESREGRIEAARLAMVIWRDKLGEAIRAESAVHRLLDEQPDDGEALDLVLTTGYDTAFRTRALGRAKSTLVQRLALSPIDADRVALLAKIAAAGQDASLRQATLGTLVALGRNDAGLSDELARLDQRVAARPQIALDAQAMAEIADPEDGGPVAEIFALMAETVSLAIGPSVQSLGVTRKERVDSRGGHPMRVAVAEWMGALGFEGDFDLYIGGVEPRGVFGVAGEQPAIVLGNQVTLPLDAGTRSAVAREVFALRRGITAVRTRDENMIASLAVAACNEVGLAVPHPGYAVFNEVARSLHKEISRKVKKVILEPCTRFAQSGQDARVWAAAARRSIDRMAVIAAGDVSIVLAELLGVPRAELGRVSADSDRARRLIAFVLSPSYLELRKKLGMGVR
ncbi:MAG: tetratricopeptide repeat protein, partial [Polyangiaceae bacterium]